MHAIDSVVRGTLATLETDFFSALESGTDALLAFDGAWTTFTAQVETYVDSLQEDTKSRIFGFATTANIIASTLLEIDNAGHSLTLQLQDDITKVIREEFGNLTISDNMPPPESQTGPAYIFPAYKWLLDNLHNPYPPKETKMAIAESTNTALKDIDAWFADVRRRIGWNKLRKDHYPKKAQLIKAATRFFKPTLSSVTPESSLEYATYPQCENAFAQMEICAENLYSDKFIPSALVSELDGAVQSQKQHRIASGGRRGQSTSYPSPANSPSRSSMPASPPPQPSILPDNNLELSDRKRKRASSSIARSFDASTDEESDCCRLSKRIRTEKAPTANDIAAMSIPSPAPSFHGDDLGIECTTHVSPYSHGEVSSKRKRAVLDDDHRSVKRINTSTAQLSEDCFPSSSYPLILPNETNIQGCLDFFCDQQEISDSMPPPVAFPVVEDFFDFDIECHSYDFSTLSSNAFGVYESDSTADSPELQEHITLPQVQEPVVNYGVESTTLFTSLLEGDIPKQNPGVLLLPHDNNPIPDFQDISANWFDGCPPVSMDNVLWPTNDLTYGSSQYDGSLNVAEDSSVRTQLSDDDKRRKMIQLHRMLKQAEALRSELNL